MKDSFKTRRRCGCGQSYEIFNLPNPGVRRRAPPSRSRYCSRTCCGSRRRQRHARRHRGLLKWDAKQHEPRDRLHAARRHHAGLHRRAGRRRPRGDARAMTRLGGNPLEINPLAPPNSSLHSVQWTNTGGRFAEEEQHDRVRPQRERYSFLRWADAFTNFKVVPPNTGIVHQVNVEHLARVVFAEERTAEAAYPTRWWYRFAHDHGQRPRRARWAGRHEPRPMLGQLSHADSARDRLPAEGPCRRRHRHHWC